MLWPSQLPSPSTIIFFLHVHPDSTHIYEASTRTFQQHTSFLILFFFFFPPPFISLTHLYISCYVTPHVFGSSNLFFCCPSVPHLFLVLWPCWGRVGWKRAPSCWDVGRMGTRERLSVLQVDIHLVWEWPPVMYMGLPTLEGFLMSYVFVYPK